MATGCMLQVSGFPLDLGDDDLLRDKLTIHFLRRRNGGNGEVTVSYPAPERGVASLTFDLREVAERVLQRSHRLEINKHTYLLEVRRQQLPTTQPSMPIRTFLRLEYFSDHSEVRKLLHKHHLRICKEEDFKLHIEGEFQDLGRCHAELLNNLARSFSSRSNEGKERISPPTAGEAFPRDDFRQELKAADNSNPHRRPPSSSEPDPQKARLSPENPPDGGSSSSEEHRGSPYRNFSLDTPSGMTGLPSLTSTKSASATSLQRKFKGRPGDDVNSNPILASIQRNANNKSTDFYSNPYTIKSSNREYEDRTTHNLTSYPRNATKSEDVYSNPDMSKTRNTKYEDRPTHNLTSNPRNANNNYREDVHSNSGVINNISRQPKEMSMHNQPSIPREPGTSSEYANSSRRNSLTKRPSLTSVSTHEQSRGPDGVSPVTIDGSLTSDMDSYQRRSMDLTVQDVNSSLKYAKSLLVEPPALQYRRPSSASDSSSEQSRRSDSISPDTIDRGHSYRSEMDSHQRRPKVQSVQDVSSQKYPQPVTKERLPKDTSTINMTSYPRKDTSEGDSKHAKSSTKAHETSNYYLASKHREPRDFPGTDPSSSQAAGGPTSRSAITKPQSERNPNESSLVTDLLVDDMVFLYIDKFKQEEIKDLLHRCNVEMETENGESFMRVVLRAKSDDFPELFYKAAREIPELFINYQNILRTEIIHLSDNSKSVPKVMEHLTNHKVFAFPTGDSLSLIGPASEVAAFMQMWSGLKTNAVTHRAQSRGAESLRGPSRRAPSPGGAARSKGGTTATHSQQPWR